MSEEIEELEKPIYMASYNKRDSQDWIDANSILRIVNTRHTESLLEACEPEEGIFEVTVFNTSGVCLERAWRSYGGIDSTDKNLKVPQPYWAEVFRKLRGDVWDAIEYGHCYRFNSFGIGYTSGLGFSKDEAISCMVLRKLGLSEIDEFCHRVHGADIYHCLLSSGTYATYANLTRVELGSEVDVRAADKMFWGRGETGTYDMS